MKTAAGVSLSHACSNTHRRWRWQPLRRQKWMWEHICNDEKWWKMPSSATLTEERGLSRTTQMHSVDLNKHVALWSPRCVLGTDLQKTGSLTRICACEVVKEEVLGFLLARVGCQEWDWLLRSHFILSAVFTQLDSRLPAAYCPSWKRRAGQCLCRKPVAITSTLNRLFSNGELYMITMVFSPLLSFS